MVPRRRNNRTRFLDEREAAARTARFNTARAGSPEPHDRRRASLGTVGDEEIDGRLGSGSVPQLPDHDGNLPKGRVGTEGRWPARELSIPGLADNPDSDAGKAVDAKSFSDYRQSAGDNISEAKNAAQNAAQNARDAQDAVARKASKQDLGKLEKRVARLEKGRKK